MRCVRRVVAGAEKIDCGGIKKWRQYQERKKLKN